MFLDLSNSWIIILNVLGIPAAHILISWICTRMPASCFEKTTTPTDGPSPLYNSLFRIRKWKHLLPDAAPWMKGFPKGSLASTNPEYLHRFILETRRGEFAHWLQWLLISTFIIWNPFPAYLVILFYAALANLPCILNLRYTRLRMAHHLTKK